MTVRINSIEDVEISSEQNKYKLIIVKGESEMLDLMLGLKIGSELLDISIDGED